MTYRSRIFRTSLLSAIYGFDSKCIFGVGLAHQDSVMISSRPKSPRRKTVWGSRFSILCATLAIAAIATPLLAAAGSDSSEQGHPHSKLDRELTRRSRTFLGGHT